MEQIVLLVDDDENLLRGLARALRQQPYNLHTVRSAEEAVWALKTRRVDLVVVDERMPGMSGGDLLSWVAQYYPEVVRIVLTGYATTDAVIRSINEGGVYHFFTKPCDIVQLAVTIRKGLEHKQARDENRRRTDSKQIRVGIFECMLRELENLDQIISDELCTALDRITREWNKPETEADSQDASKDVQAMADGAARASRIVQALIAHVRSAGICRVAVHDGN